MEAIIKGTTALLAESPDPLIFFHLKNRRHTFRLRESDSLELEVFFLQKETEYATRWAEMFKSYLADPDTGRNFDLVALGEVEERDFEKLASETGAIPEEGEVCLEFMTPFPFKAEKGKQRTCITEEAFIRSFERRFSRLFGRNITYARCNDDFSLLPYYWNYTEIRHPSHSQPGHVQYINGCVGKLYLKGRFGEFLPFLVLGSELHTGSKISNAQGYYIIHEESPPYFQKFFPNKKAILSVIHEVLNTYDNALESLSTEEDFPFDEDTFSERLYQEIVADTYTPAPNRAFLIKKKDGTQRLVEQLEFKDLIVQQYLLRTITEPFERIFAEGSIGFRKGISRARAVQAVNEAIKQGYRYVVESDIEDFFPSVDHAILSRLLDFYLPEKDHLVRSLLEKSARNGFVLNGVFHERRRGLAQGSPLSPILANLYLDSFDEFVMHWNVKMIRYADDFIIMTRTREEAEEILSKTESFLCEIGLKLKKAKTAIKPIKEGFSFLGMRFTKSEVVVAPEEEYRRLKKPLYVSEPYLFLSLNGEAVDIKKQGTLQETIPLRRISEIIVMERAALSTALVRKCTESNIPLTITLDSGYYITTIKPDSKQYHDISFAHASKYYSLSDTEILSIAKEIAACKLGNYISMFKQRYAPELNQALGEIESFINRIHQAADIHQVRGLEGAAARVTYQTLNLFIDDPTFHLRKRQRKNPDRINSLLNYGYYLLFSRINATLRALGLNPYLGFLHSPEDNFESLVCDIQELFRARIDRFIIRLINLKVIKGDDFRETGNGFYLTREARKRFLNQFEGEMERKSSKKNLSMKESIYVQALVLKNYVLEDKPLSFYQWNV